MSVANLIHAYQLFDLDTHDFFVQLLTPSIIIFSRNLFVEQFTPDSVVHSNSLGIFNGIIVIDVCSISCMLFHTSLAFIY